MLGFLWYCFILFLVFLFADIWLQENNNEGEGQSEPPLVDLSKEEGNPHSEPKTVEAAAAVSVEAGEETEKKTEDKVEALVSESKDKAVEAGDETPEPAKEGKDEAEEGKVEVKEGKDEAKEGKDEAIADKSDVAPLSDNKIDAPLVTA